MAKRRSRASKSARRRANKSTTERSKAKAAKQEKAAQRMKVEIPEPSPKADPDAALEAVAAYREALREWQSLPFWKRMVTAKPRHPTGV